MAANEVCTSCSQGCKCSSDACLKVKCKDCNDNNCACANVCALCTSDCNCSGCDKTACPKCTDEGCTCGK